MTGEDLLKIYANKSEKYSLSTEYMINYHQKDGGYIDYATKINKLIKFDEGEPNQKWHFLVSYYDYLVKGNKLESWKKRTANDIYTCLKCPELKLWMLEAVGFDKNRIKTLIGKISKLKDEQASFGVICSTFNETISGSEYEEFLVNKKDL